jgi:zinc transport system substrate-binding protein
MPRATHVLGFAFVAALVLGHSPPAAAAPKVVASIPPVASLAAGVMQGVGAPTTIIPPGASLHSFALKPSDARALDDADVVIWVGDGFEAFLEKPIATLAGRATVLALIDAPGVTALKGREGGVWESHDDHDHDHDRDQHDDHDTHEDHAHDVDGHIWLDPANAKAMTMAIAGTLSARDPANAPAYAANALKLAERIDALDAELAAALAPIRSRPFVVFHDATQYLEAKYGLNAVGAITVSPDRPPGARRIAEIKARIASLNAACVFAEPQFEPKLVATLIEGTPARAGTLDPEGSRLQPGTELYFQLMRALAADLSACLAGG